MAEFYTWPWVLRALITLLLALCVLTQTLATALRFFSRKGRFKVLPELCLLALILFCSLLYGQIANGFGIGLVAPVGFGALRVPMEGRAWAWGYLGLLLCLLARGVWVCLRRYRDIRTGVSALSLKNAIDSLPSGVLFSEPDGFILLSNAKMQWLMMTLTSSVQHSSRDFYGLLSHGELQPGCRKTEFEGKIVCLLPDHSAWMFTRTNLRIGRKTYLQLTAADITERWELTAQLQRQNGQLAQKSGELRRTIENLHALNLERETQKAKTRAHDVLGQRLSLLQRAVRGERPDYDLLRSLSQGLLEELRVGREAPCAQEFLDSLRRDFRLIGVEIALEGPLPEGCAGRELFADIVRESTTNAVRHGIATRVDIRIERTGAGCRMRITDNGPPPPGPAAEGGGLGSIRKKVEACGGALRVTCQPQFVLEIDLPGGDEDA